MRRLELDVTTLNPVCAADGGERYVAKYLFTPLLYLDANMHPIAGLATSWRISEDKRRYRFTLNPKATFTDGTRVRASDVAFTLRKIADPASQSTIADSFGDLDQSQTRVIDDHTIEAVFHRPLATQLTRFADVYVLPEHVYSKGNFRNDFHATATGSGPYRLVRRDPGKEIVVERRKEYWGERPHIQTVIFKVIGDHQTAWNALKAGDIDETVVTSDTWERERRTPTSTHLELRTFYPLQYNYFAWNAQRPVLQDKRVRRALGMAIPVDAVVRNLYHGTARALSGPFTPDEDAYNHAVPQLPYAPERARRLLADAGWRDRDNDGVLEKDSQRCDIVLQIMPGRISQQFAELLQSEFKRIGVHLEISVIDSASAIQRIVQGNYDAAFLAWNLDADPDLYSKFHSSQVPPHGRNFVFYANPTVDGLIAAARTEFDRSKRQQLHQRLHAILAEDQPYTWVVQVAAKWAFNKRVRGVEASNGNGLFLWYPGEFGWWIDPAQH